MINKINQDAKQLTPNQSIKIEPNKPYLKQSSRQGEEKEFTGLLGRGRRNSCSWRPVLVLTSWSTQSNGDSKERSCTVATTRTTATVHTWKRLTVSSKEKRSCIDKNSKHRPKQIATREEEDGNINNSYSRAEIEQTARKKTWLWCLA